MHCMIVASREMSDEPYFCQPNVNLIGFSDTFWAKKTL